MPRKGKELYEGYILFPAKINKDENSKFAEPLQLGSQLVETDCYDVV